MPPPFTAATSLFPSVEEATQVRNPGGTLVFQVQFVPESSEVKTPRLPPATNLMPSAEQAMEFQNETGEPVACQVSPPSREA
jgi:hypothetical protein